MENRFEEEYFKRKYEFAIQDVEALETVFLRPLETDTSRTPAEEARLLKYSEAIFELGASARKQLEAIIETRGPAVTVSPPI